MSCSKEEHYVVATLSCISVAALVNPFLTSVLLTTLCPLSLHAMRASTQSFPWHAPLWSLMKFGISATQFCFLAVLTWPTLIMGKFGHSSWSFRPWRSSTTAKTQRSVPSIISHHSCDTNRALQLKSRCMDSCLNKSGRIAIIPKVVSIRDYPKSGVYQRLFR